jgi:hypothetical protein
MSLKFHVGPGDQVYRCWKKAVNTLWTPERGVAGTMAFVAVEHGCKTVQVHKKEHTPYTNSVELEFNNDAELTMFLLRWS